MDSWSVLLATSAALIVVSSTLSGACNFSVFPPPLLSSSHEPERGPGVARDPKLDCTLLSVGLA